MTSGQGDGGNEILDLTFLPVDENTGLWQIIGLRKLQQPYAGLYYLHVPDNSFVKSMMCDSFRSVAYPSISVDFSFQIFLRLEKRSNVNKAGRKLVILNPSLNHSST